MKYYLIVGEASGDLHASRLMHSLKNIDEFAEFRFFGGDLMAAEGGTRVKHYKELAYMGFVPVLLHIIIFRLRFGPGRNGASAALSAILPNSSQSCLSRFRSSRKNIAIPSITWVILRQKR